MPHDTELIGTLAAGLSLAFIAGLIAFRLRLPPIVGYLIAGIAVGPFTPGFVADTHLAPQLAEIGVILLMFGVGLHFSLKDLLAVRNVAIPGAVGQIAVATLLGIGVSRLWGWSTGEGLVFGLALSVASTVVLLRALTERKELKSPHGQVAVGWLIVEDIATVLALVLIPVLAEPLGGVPLSTSEDSVAMTLALALGKVAIFAAVMLVLGVRFIPWLLTRVAGTASRELFILAVLASALGIAYGAARLFDVSFALGAFLAGLVLAESDVGHNAAEELVPLRDAFAVLFFVSVGMLIDPSFLIDDPLRILVVAAIVIVGKGVAAMGIVLLLKRPVRTGLTVAAGLAQIGEFSFILASMGTALALLPDEGNELILAGALVSITLNPLLFRLIDPMEAWLTRRRPHLAETPA
ncbi:MAG: cation:proton antiporter [Thermomicrobiales bacterium]|nr:cation:proton antiporter [Thermomicrobiales bacterium]